ncbi:CHASE2 domain-containing protein [Amphibiibacter pelophylacis]|uniref:Adenylate/guanylate cyclase domain-containing protein n=1 Tax=Amphibiibacter pelophylacis TaxID=1799477 RepID=A0ACC6NY03_9BURK
MSARAASRERWLGWREALWRLPLRWLVGLALGFLVTLGTFHAVGVLRLAPVERVEWWLQDVRSLALRRPSSAPIVIVDIDEASLQRLGRWPWPRETLAGLTRELTTTLGARAVAFDLVLAEPEQTVPLQAWQRLTQQHPALNRYTRDWQSLTQPDPALGAWLAQQPVVLGYYLTSDRLGQRNGHLPPPLFPAPGLISPWTGYGASTRAYAGVRGGFINALPDRDGVVRRVPLVTPLDGQFYGSLALSLYLLPHSGMQVQPQWLPASRSDSGQRLLLGLTLTPPGQAARTMGLGRMGDVLVPWRSARPASEDSPGPPSAFDRISAATLWQARQGELAPAQVAALRARLQGRLVLVGSSAPALADLRATPIAPALPGVEVHAHVLSGLIDGDLPWRPDWASGYEILSLIVVGLWVGSAVLWLGPWSGVMSLLGCTSCLVALNLWLYRSEHWALPMAAPLMLAALLYIGATSWGYVTQTRQKRDLVRLFGSYVPPELVRQMARHPGRYSLQAENRELTVMFCDLRGFTALAEGLDPSALRDIINLFLSRMSAVVHRHQGTVDKYIGDAIMAFWGAPVAQPDHAWRAVRCALAMQTALAELNQDLAQRGLPGVGMGVGLNTGMVCVGDMGSDVRRTYTVIGDAVNVAARLEALTRQFGVAVLASAATQLACTPWQKHPAPAPGKGRGRPVTPPGPEWHWQAVAEVQVKGRQQKVAVLTPVLRDPVCVHNSTPAGAISHTAGD